MGCSGCLQSAELYPNREDGARNPPVSGAENAQSVPLPTEVLDAIAGALSDALDTGILAEMRTNSQVFELMVDSPRGTLQIRIGEHAPETARMPCSRSSPAARWSFTRRVICPQRSGQLRSSLRNPRRCRCCSGRGTSNRSNQRTKAVLRIDVGRDRVRTVATTRRTEAHERELRCLQ